MASTRRSVAIVTNPFSGRRKGQHQAAFLQSLFDSVSQPVDIAFLESTAPGGRVRELEFPEGSAGWLARRAAGEGYDIVAAAGGDGTVNEVASALIGSEAVLGILPMGTGNDLARTIGVGTDLKRAAECIATGTVREIDCGRVGNGYFVNVAGCGFDAQVATKINSGFKFLKGRPAYLAAVMSTLLSYRPIPINLTVDGIQHQLEVMLCAVANAKCYGGGMMIAPQADLSDGLLDVVVVKSVGKLEFLRAFPRVFSGNHLSHPKVESFRGKSIRIESAVDAPVLADGEEIGTTPVEFEVVPRALKVLVPAET
ncbi:diacylglycerol kinase family lipid kinase [Kamptonema cortianum]|nr:diacylglycerol kinase family lipid kinase [Geitlerinema splendidum]MDK3157066.1 diacylglycerol kinase family lipid kinase [Kamptonema cortianum]